MTQGVKDLIAAIAAGDSVAIDAAWNAEMATRISSKLDDMRVSVAKNMFATEQAVEDEDISSIEQVEIPEQFESDELALSEEDVSKIVEGYMGFKKLKGELAAKGAKNPEALAAWIGRKKYGKEKFQAKAAAGK